MLARSTSIPVCLCLVLFSAAHVDTSPQAIRTFSRVRLMPDGHPDLQGTWVNRFATPLERPQGLEDRALLTDLEVAQLNKMAARNFTDGQVMVVPSGRTLTTLLNGAAPVPGTANYDPAFFTEFEFENRTSLISDPPNGRLPAYTRAGQERRDAKRGTAESVQDLPPETRCLTFGMPRVAGVAGTASAGIYAYYQIVQTPNDVLFFMEAVHEARVIPLDSRPYLPSSIRTWDGDSRGHWDGDTLVVDTRGFRPEMNFLGAGDGMHLIERLRLSGPDELRDEIRVEDPATWVQPWTATVRLRRTREQLYEFACHEGNARIIEGMLATSSKDR